MVTTRMSLLLLLLSAQLAEFSYKLVKCCLCDWMLTRVAQIVTDTQTCNLACIDLPMNFDCTPITRSVRPTLRVKIAHRKRLVLMGIFKPVEPHRAQYACYNDYGDGDDYYPIFVICGRSVCSIK